MEQTTQSPPNNAEQAGAERPANNTKPLPATEEDFHTRPSRTQSSGFRIGVVIAIIILLIAGFFAYRYFTSYESTDDAQIDGHVNSVSARISGHVVELNVLDNQYVQAGTVLVEIDPADYQVAYERAKADFEDAQAAALAAGVTVPITSINTNGQVSASEADVSSARAGIQVAKQQFEAAKAQLQEAEANNVKAQNDLGRYKQLVDKQEISQQQYDQAIAAAKASEATVEAARAGADAAQQQVTQAQGKLVQAEVNSRYANTAPKQMQITRAKAASALAEAQRKKADLDQAQLNLQYTKIVAPVNGIVSDRTVEVGQNVAPGQELMKIINLDDIWITANFKETQLRQMKVGQKVTVEVDANGRSYNGKVDSVAGASGARFSLLPPENATGNYVKVVQRIPVKIVLDRGSNNDHQLRPGESVTPKVWIR
ncbi:MAG TPA: HlyD family secretion protein [Candidatus Sulfotelmatobacter sp.]|jgi:membrane fusion protein (multidrug efflux system)|nr:HlyD family secretion protein [Candidatus Sulfotelmatobacter sp.]